MQLLSGSLQKISDQSPVDGSDPHGQMNSQGRSWTCTHREYLKWKRTGGKRKEFNPRKRDWENVYTDCQRNSDGSENCHWQTSYVRVKMRRFRSQLLRFPSYRADIHQATRKNTCLDWLKAPILLAYTELQKSSKTYRWLRSVRRLKKDLYGAW